MQDILKGRDTILWDFDGVLYSYHFNDISEQELEKNFFSANAKGAQELIPDLSYEEAYKMGGDTFLQYHDTVTGFMPFAAKVGMEEQEFKKRLLTAQLKWSFKHISENIPQLIEPCPETNELFDRLSGYLKHAIITHSNAEQWAVPVARNLGVAPYMDYILGYDDFDFISKGQSAHALTIALDKLGSEAKYAIFVEDQLKHLEIAKAAYPQICCVFIEGPEPIEAPEYVDIMIKRPKHFLEVMVDMLEDKKV